MTNDTDEVIDRFERKNLSFAKIKLDTREIVHEEVNSVNEGTLSRVILKLLQKLELVHHDVPRSKYIQRLIEKNLQVGEMSVILNPEINLSSRNMKVVGKHVVEPRCKHNIRIIIRQGGRMKKDGMGDRTGDRDTKFPGTR